MNLKRPLLTLLLMSCVLSASASYNFDARCTGAYKAIFSLRMNDARELIALAKRADPDNGIPVLLDNYVDYLDLFITDSRIDYERLKDRKSKRIDALEGNIDENSPYYLFAQAEIYLQWGMVQGKFGDYTAAGADMRKARRLLLENADKFPDFVLNQKSLGTINVIFGALPANLKMIARLFGMSGNIQTGVAQIEKLRYELPDTKYSFYNDEVIFLLCYVDLDVLHNRTNYTKLMSFLTALDSKSVLRIYLQGYVAAKTGHNDEAISYLQAVQKSSNASYLTIPAIDYLLGCAKLCRMDSDAYTFLLKYINEYRGENLIKDAYLKIGYYYLLKGDELNYIYYVKMARFKGYAGNEKDKQALKEANDAKPDIALLKARFYFDGAYYDKALAQFKGKQDIDFKLLRDRIEYNYRLGRIYDLLGRYNEAISYYQKSINLGKSTTYYFAANAALYIGNIYERIKDYDLAATYFNLAISMRNHEYKRSIDTESKLALDRINR
jgi:tetratricopeptide (TPR) repeat protein